MFSNIGGKIKGLAVAICVLGIIASVISGIYLISLHESFILSGIITIVVGVLVSWLSVFTLYGFGELIENSQLTYETTYKIYKELHKKDAAKAEPIRTSAPVNPYFNAPQNNFNNVPPQNIPMQQPIAPPPPPQYMQPPVAPQRPSEPVAPVTPPPSFEPAPAAPQPAFEPAAPVEPVAPQTPVEPVTPVESAAPRQPAYRPDVVIDGNLVVCPSCGSKNIYGNDMCWRCSLKLME